MTALLPNTLTKLDAEIKLSTDVINPKTKGLSIFS